MHHQQQTRRSLDGDGKQLFEWDGTRLTPFQPRKEGDAGISFAHHDGRNRLWIAFWDGSVGILSPDRSLRILSRQTFGQDDTAVFSILEDAPRHAMWLATSNGISRLKDEKVTTLTTAHGLPGNHVWSLAQDHQGFIWASVDLGVVRFSPEEFEQATAGSGPRLRYQLYDPSDGLAGAPILNVQWAVSATKALVREGRRAHSAILSRWPPRSRRRPGRPYRGSQQRRSRVRGRTASDFRPASSGLEINYTTVALTHPNESCSGIAWMGSTRSGSKPEPAGRRRIRIFLHVTTCSGSRPTRTMARGTMLPPLGTSASGRCSIRRGTSTPPACSRCPQ